MAGAGALASNPRLEVIARRIFGHELDSNSLRSVLPRRNTVIQTPACKENPACHPHWRLPQSGRRPGAPAGGTEGGELAARKEGERPGRRVAEQVQSGCNAGAEDPAADGVNQG